MSFKVHCAECQGEDRIPWWILKDKQSRMMIPIHDEMQFLIACMVEEWIVPELAPLMSGLFTGCYAPITAGIRVTTIHGQTNKGLPNLYIFQILKNILVFPVISWYNLLPNKRDLLWSDIQVTTIKIMEKAIYLEVLKNKTLIYVIQIMQRLSGWIMVTFAGKAEVGHDFQYLRALF